MDYCILSCLSLKHSKVYSCDAACACPVSSSTPLSRSCSAAVVLTQTVANFHLAFDQGLSLLPVLNKVDISSADPDAVTEEMVATFDVQPEDVLRVSAKTGLGCEALLPAIVR